MVHGPLFPVGGDPASARALAAVLDGQAEWVGTVERVLHGLAEGGLTAWEGAAGRAFADAAARPGPVLRGVAHRYAVSAAVVRRLADALAHAQSECAAAQRVHEQARGEVVAIGEARVLVQDSGDPAALAAVPRLTADLVDAGERVASAERRHATAWDHYLEEDRSCAAVLAALTRDGLADSGGYDALTGTSRAADAIASAASVPASVPAAPLRVFDAVEQAAAGVGVVADAATWVRYGDGDLGAIVLSGVAAGAGPVSSVLKRGAAATNPAAAAAATRAERRALRLSTGERLRVGVTTRSTAGKARPPVPWTPPPRSATAVRRWAMDQAEARVATTVRRRWVDDLDAVTRTPGASAPMLLTAFAVEATGAGAGRAADVAALHEARRHRLQREQAHRDQVHPRHDPVPR